MYGGGGGGGGWYLNFRDSTAGLVCLNQKYDSKSKICHITPTYVDFCWKVKILSIQCMAGFGNLKPEENWQYIDLDAFFTVSYGNYICVVPLIPQFVRLYEEIIHELK